LTFQTTIYSSSSTISKAWFIYTIQSELHGSIVNRVPLDVDPAQRVEATITWESEDQVAIPGLPFLIRWEAQDESGLRIRSEETLVRYEDNRFDWQVIEDDSLSVWWHGHPREFGQQIFDIAVTAVADQSELFQTALRFPIRVMIYNNTEESEEICLCGEAVVGGRAYPEFGITAQVVPMNPFLWTWMSEVIPHEISHLYFAQVTTSNFGEDPPMWLNEGIAQINEPIDHTYETELVENAAMNGDLIPLTELVEGFGRYQGTLSDLAYAESYSAVQFLVEELSTKSLGVLFYVYRSGMANDDVFRSALGYDLGEFQRRWLDWLGTSITFPPTKTPLAPKQSESHSQVTREATKRSRTPTPTPSNTYETPMTVAPKKAMPQNQVPLPIIVMALPFGFFIIFLGVCFIIWRKFRRER